MDLDVDVYLLPTGHLCVWCEDVGISGIGETRWSDHQWLGHIPVEWFDDDPDSWRETLNATSA